MSSATNRTRFLCDCKTGPVGESLALLILWGYAVLGAHIVLLWVPEILSR